MADYTISSSAPTLTFEDTDSGDDDYRIVVDADVLTFERPDGGSWVPVMWVDTNRQVHAQRRLEVEQLSNESILHLEGGSAHWRLRSTSPRLFLERAPSDDLSAWTEYMSVAEQTWYLGGQLHRTGTLVVNQTDSTLTCIARFSTAAGTTPQCFVHTDGRAICNEGGFRLRVVLSAPGTSDGMVGDMLVVTDASYVSRLYIKTSAGWKAHELNLS